MTAWPYTRVSTVNLITLYLFFAIVFFQLTTNGMYSVPHDADRCGVGEYEMNIVDG